MQCPLHHQPTSAENFTARNSLHENALRRPSPINARLANPNRIGPYLRNPLTHSHVKATNWLAGWLTLVYWLHRTVVSWWKSWTCAPTYPHHQRNRELARELGSGGIPPDLALWVSELSCGRSDGEKAELKFCYVK